jgi:MiaB/RimO family radical SAM methylthiotransferase
MNVQLSLDETYADIAPVRKANDLHAWISIMRGCNNMCSFCIVPFVRGRERNRTAQSIIDEVKTLRDQGVKEITLLGQNVNSYHDKTTESGLEHTNSEGFVEMYKARSENGLRFAELLDSVAEVAPEVRFRFTSPHPKDFPDPLLDVIADRANVCKQIHIPAQSGNTEMLFRMRRNHSRESYLSLIERMREKIPGVALSSDFICGFCQESDAEFEDTVSLLNIVKYDLAFLFAYSMRERTHAHRRLVDDVPEDIKQARLVRMIDTFKRHQLEKQREEVGRYHLVLVDGKGKKGEQQLSGLTDTMKRAVFDSTEYQKGDFVLCRVTDYAQNTLFCEAQRRMGVQEFATFIRQ